jgi:hypothetical protein
MLPCHRRRGCVDVAQDGRPLASLPTSSSPSNAVLACMPPSTMSCWCRRWLSARPVAVVDFPVEEVRQDRRCSTNVGPLAPFSSLTSPLIASLSSGACCTSGSWLFWCKLIAGILIHDVVSMPVSTNSISSAWCCCKVLQASLRAHYQKTTSIFFFKLRFFILSIINNLIWFYSGLKYCTAWVWLKDGSQLLRDKWSWSHKKDSVCIGTKLGGGSGPSKTKLV